MFDIGWSEMAIILLVALIVIGPKDLPRVARTVGRWAAKGRALAREFQNSLEEMAREAELDKVKSEIEKAGRVNPKKMIENTIDPTGELGRAMDPTAGGDAPRSGSGPRRATVGAAEVGADQAPPAVADERAADEAALPPPAVGGGAGATGGGSEAERVRRPEPVE